VIIRDAKVKKVIIKDQEGNVLLSIPVTWRATGAIVILALEPWFAAIGVIAGIMTKCMEEVEEI
jgi:Domain of unknown function (DUF4342)